MKKILYFLIVVLALSCTRTEQPVVTSPAMDDEFPEKEGGEMVASLEVVNIECVARVI